MRLFVLLDGIHDRTTGLVPSRVAIINAMEPARQGVRVVKHDPGFLFLAENFALGDGAGGRQGLAVGMGGCDLRDCCRGRRRRGGRRRVLIPAIQHVDGNRLDSPRAIGSIHNLRALGYQLALSAVLQPGYRRQQGAAQRLVGAERRLRSRRWRRAVEEAGRSREDSLRKGEDSVGGGDGDDAVEGAEVRRKIFVAAVGVEDEFGEALDGVGGGGGEVGGERGADGGVEGEDVLGEGGGFRGGEARDGGPRWGSGGGIFLVAGLGVLT